MLTRNSSVMCELVGRIDKLEESMPMDPDPTKRLVRAVVLQAVKDELAALQTLRKNPKHKAALEMLKKTEAFFRSDWGEFLSGICGNWLIRNLREMVPPLTGKTTGTKNSPEEKQMTLQEKRAQLLEQLKQTGGY